MSAHSTASSQAQYWGYIFLGQLREPTRLASHQAVLPVVLPCKISPALCAQRLMHMASLLLCPK